MRSGTWLSVDVSPDGKRIVFNLLGDIYELRVDGGDARALTSGTAWDMQRRCIRGAQWARLRRRLDARDDVGGRELAPFYWEAAMAR